MLNHAVGARWRLSGSRNPFRGESPTPMCESEHHREASTERSDAPMKPYLVGIVFMLLAATVRLTGRRRLSFRAQFERDVAPRLARDTSVATVRDADLESLPAAIQRYLRLAGVVGQPRVLNFRARMRGQIRGGPDARWMSFAAEQYNFFNDASRFFILDAAMAGVPVRAFHRYVGGSATMRVRLASLLTIADASGAEMDQAETVTLFNDMCLFAPAALIDAPVRWREIDARTVAATFTNAAHTISAILTFDDNGELVDFVSDDRFASTADGKRFTRMRWSTPVRDYRTYGQHRVASRGEGRWHSPSGEYTYIRLEVESVEYNLTSLSSTASNTRQLVHHEPGTSPFRSRGRSAARSY
jgi:hypothetical protein